MAEAVAERLLAEGTKGDEKGQKGTKEDEGARSGIVDLGSRLVIVPSAFAGRLIQEELAIQQTNGVLLPQLESPDRFLSRSESRPSAPGSLVVAGPVESRVAWLAVFERAKREDFPSLLPKAQPGTFTFDQANDLARKLARLRDELGGSEMGHDFAALAALKDNHEPERWSDLAKLEALYRREMAERGWIDHNDHRTQLALGRGAPETAETIFLAALPDPQPLLITALRRLAEEGKRVVVLVGAAAADSELFDAWGRPLGQAWKDRRADWPQFDQRVHVVPDPASGLSCLRQLLGGQKPVDGTLAVCACDREKDSARLTGLMHSLGAEATNPLGRPHAGHVLHHALRLWSACLESKEPGFAEIRAVVHLPILVRGVAGGRAAGSFEQINRWLDAADEAFLRGCLGELITQAETYPEGEETHDRIRHEAIRQLAQSLRVIEKERTEQLGMPAREALLRTLGLLTEGEKIDLSTEEGNFATDVLDDLEDAAERLAAATAGMNLSHPQFFALVLESTGATRFRWSEGAESVNLPGWVEAAWDPVPHLVIFGLNDHLVPRVRHADPFLPAKMRQQAKLAGNDELFAAAAFSLERMRRQRASGGRLDVIVPQASEEGDPLRPSRLLFLAPDDQLTNRVRRLFADAPSAEPEPYWEVLERHKLDPTGRPERVEKLADKLSASKIRDYLADPSEFWLKRALGMDSVEHGRVELNAAAFGTLTHGALQRYGEEEIARDSALTEPSEIIAKLLRYLTEQVRSTYGDSAPPAVVLQASAAEARLRAFAVAQARLARDGWKIEAVEASLPPLTLLGSTIEGRFDRLDRNERTGAWRVFDYKTSADAQNPRHTHLRNPRPGEDAFLIDLPGEPKEDGTDGAAKTKRWIDLQLPIYHAALRAGHGEIGEAPLEIGYLCLPALSTQSGPQIWEGYDALAKDAGKAIEAVIQAIRSGGPEAFAPAQRRPDYPLLPELASRPTDGWMLTEKLGRAAK